METLSILQCRKAIGEGNVLYFYTPISVVVFKLCAPWTRLIWGVGGSQGVMGCQVVPRSSRCPSPRERRVFSPGGLEKARETQRTVNLNRPKPALAVAPLRKTLTPFLSRGSFSHSSSVYLGHASRLPHAQIGTHTHSTVTIRPSTHTHTHTHTHTRARS